MCCLQDLYMFAVCDLYDSIDLDLYDLWNLYGLAM